MPIKVRRIGEVQIVELAGEFTFGGNALARPLDLQGRPLEDLSRILIKLFDRGDRRIVLDMHQVSFVDSGGLGELIASKKRALDRGGEIKILQPSRRVRDLLVVTRLDQVFEIYDDEAAAVRSFA